MINLRYAPVWGIGLTIIFLLSNCIKGDSQSSCGSQGINIYFYSKTICQSDTLYPEEIQDIRVAVFDKEDRLVSYTHNSISELHSGYFQQMELNSGLYTLIAWSGVDDEYFTPEDLQEGVTQKDDLLFRIKREGENARDISGSKLFYGQSPAFYVEENETPDPLFEKVSVNMQEVTNRLHISVTGLTSPEQFGIFIESNNGSMNIDGTIAADETLLYTVENSEDGYALEADFTLLKLMTGYENTIVIKNIISNSEIYRGNLLGALLLKNPEVNLLCDHDFSIRFTAEDRCDCGTYTMMEIRVNEWLVHSYDTEM